MKRIFLVIITAILCLNASGQDTEWHNAANLNIIGKAIPTSKPYTRINNSKYEFNNKTIEKYTGYATGLAILFETDSPVIKARWTTGGRNYLANMTAIGQKGLDLYIMKDGASYISRFLTP